MYWAEALAAQNEDEELKARFAKIADALTSKEPKIIDELNSVQGSAMDIGGYYKPDAAKAAAAMRPSATFNEILGQL